MKFGKVVGDIIYSLDGCWMGLIFFHLLYRGGNLFINI